MAPYVQTCRCVARITTARRDMERYQHRVASLRVDVQAIWNDANVANTAFAEERRKGAPDERRLLELRAEIDQTARDVYDLMKEIKRNERSYLKAELHLGEALLTGDCHICRGAGRVMGNGSAQIGGSGRTGALVE